MINIIVTTRNVEEEFIYPIRRKYSIQHIRIRIESNQISKKLMFIGND